MDQPLPELLISVSMDEGTPEEIDELTRQLRSEIQDLNVESIENVSAGPAPAGAKAVDWVSVGQMTVTLAPVVVPPLFGLLKSWVERKPTTPVKIRVKVGRRTAEIEYDPTKVSTEDLQALVKSLLKPPKK